MDKTKRKMIDSVKKALDEEFGDKEFADVDIINIHDDKSGLYLLKSGSGGFTKYVFGDTLQDNIQEHFTNDDQLEVAEHFVHLLMNKYGMNRYEKMSKETLEHLEKVLDYLYEDELKHYNEMSGPQGHIFESVDTLRDWKGQ